MASLFGSVLGVANQRQQGQMQGQQTLRDLAAQQEAAALAQRKQTFEEALQAAQIGNYQSEAQDRTWKQQHPEIDPNAPEVLGRKTQSEIAIAQARAKAEAANRAPQEAYQFMQGSDPATGQPYMVKGNKVSGSLEQTDIGGKPIRSGAGGGGSSGAQVPVADMEQRYGEIASAAKNLASGKLKITPTMQTREGLNYANDLGTAGGHPSVGNILAAGAFNTVGAGGAGYNDYEQLMTSTRALGDDVAKVFKGRQNEASVLREIALSRLTPNDAGNPANVEVKLSRLRHVIALAKLNNPGQDGLEAPALPSHAPSQGAAIGGGFDDLPNAR